MSTEHVPPRPDGTHPGPVPPPPAPAAGGRPPATWKWWEAVGVYVLAFLIGGLVTLPVLELVDDEGLASLASTALAAAAVVAVLLVWLRASHPTWRGAVGFPAPGRWWAEVRSGVGYGLLLYPGIVFGVGLVVSLVLGALSGEPVRAPEQVPRELSPAGYVVTALYAVVVAPFHEELFFRGILYRGVRDRHGFGPGLLASGLGFSLIHYLQGPWQDTLLLMGVMFFNGIALAWIYERRGNLVANTVAHATFNVIGLTLILAFR